MASTNIVSPADFKAAEKDLKAILKAAKDPRGGFKKWKKLLRPLKFTAKPGNFNNEMISRDAVEQNDFFTRLPAEIKRNIWTRLLEPADRVALALTCKWNARYLEDLKAEGDRRKAAKEAAAESRMAAEEQTEVTVLLKRTGLDTLEDRLFWSLAKSMCRTEQFNLMYRLRGWMNFGHRELDQEVTIWKLSYGCLKYRPRHCSNKWASWSGKEVTLEPRLNSFTYAEIRKAMGEGNHCADCNLRSRMELVQHKKEFKVLKHNIAKTANRRLRKLSAVSMKTLSA